MAVPEPAAGGLLQPIGEGLSVLMIGLGLAWNYMRGRKSAEAEPKPSSHMVLDGASIADLRPLYDRIDKLQATGDMQNLHLAAIEQTQTAILKEMRDQAKEDRDRREEEDQEELRAFRSERQMMELVKRIDKRREHDKEERE